MNRCYRCKGNGFIRWFDGDEEREDMCEACGGTGRQYESEAEEVGLPRYRRPEIPKGNGVK
jgi:DnaJ-class molecular chaperone